MNDGLKKFEELLKTDTTFQEKLKAAMENYTGEQTDEEVFDGVLIPIAKEYGISASFEEFKEYVANISTEDRELSEDEVNQVAGGTKGIGFGTTACLGIGVGLGGSYSDDTSVCAVVGIGSGADACAGEGQSASAF